VGSHRDGEARAAQDHTVTPAVERTYPLEEAAGAVQHMAEGRARGKVVVTVSQG
jgi:NADPH:quinone reductase-like Zn-dependent oxidoreductase